MKILLFLLILTVFLVGVSECRLHLKAAARNQLTQTLQAECTSRGVEDVDEITDQSLLAADCIERVFNSSDVFTQNTIFNTNMDDNSTNEVYLQMMREVCKNRDGLTQCAHRLLYSIDPCAPQNAKDQIEDMKSAVVSFFDYVCDDDCAKIRRFLDDGSYSCLRDNGFGVAYCTNNMTEIYTTLPKDTESFEATVIDSCQRFDAMQSCLSLAIKCPKPSTLEFVNDVLTLIRKGTYCRFTAPQPSKKEENNKV